MKTVKEIREMQTPFEESLQNPDRDEPTVSAREICAVRDALRLHNYEISTGAICDIIFALKRVSNVPTAL